MNQLNGNINAALILIDRAIESLSEKGVHCDFCGEELDISECEVLDDLRDAKEWLLRVIAPVTGNNKLESEMAETTDKTAREIAQELASEGMHCNCDLDNWMPERSTGHSCVCRIHKAAIERHKNGQ